MSRFIVTAVMVFMSAAAPLAAGGIFQSEYQKIIPVEGSLSVTVYNPQGTVRVGINTENHLRIDAVKNVRADSEEEANLIADHIQMDISEADGHIAIKPRFLLIREETPSFWQKLFGAGTESIHGSVDIVISVPPDCNVGIANPAGAVEVIGLSGRVEVSTRSGSVTVRDILGAVTVESSSGPIDIRDIEGDIDIKANGSEISFYSIIGNLEIRNSSGRTSGEYLIGDVIVAQTGGDIEIGRIEGDIRVKTISGQVAVGQDFGALDIATETGDIDIMTELNSSKDYFVETISGSIRFLVPEASSGDVRIEAGSCEIDTQIPIAIDSFSRTRISGRFGGGGPKISLATMSGGITLAEY